MELFGFNLSHFSNNIQLSVCISAVFIFHLLYGYTLEYTFKVSELKTYGWFVTAVQFGLYTFFGFMETNIRNLGPKRIPWETYLFLGFLSVGTILLSNTSLIYLNYPTQVMFKCCKLIPVMLGGVLIQKKLYSALEYVAVCLMTVGLLVFSSADTSMSPEFNIIGVAMIAGALLFDALIGNYQEKAMKDHDASNIEVVYYGSATGFLFVFVGCVLNGELIPAIKECLESKPTVYLSLLVLSVTGYFGIQVVLCLVKYFGALIAVMVTTFRKIVSVVISFIFFAKPFTIQYLVGGLLVFAGVYLNTLIKSKVISEDLLAARLTGWKTALFGATKKKDVFEV